MSVREQIGPDSYVTVGMVVNYDSYAPAKRAEEPEEEIEESDDVASEPVAD